MAVNDNRVPIPHFGQTNFGYARPENAPIGFEIAGPIPKMRPSLQHLTCRYWLYGREGCLYRDCPYAHFDTGTLSAYKDQRGTCRLWKQGRCKYDAAICEFEHEETGVISDVPLWTGQVGRQRARSLTGINLVIAKAAEKSGFDISHRAALMELVFAVRRAGGLRGNRRRRPPPHPIYPDRYRPGDKRRRESEEVEVVGRIGGHLVTSGTGTSDNPIALDDEDGGMRAARPNSLAKRRRTEGNDTIIRHERAVLGARSGNACYPHSSIQGHARDTTIPPPGRRGDDTISVLRAVGQTFVENKKAILYCTDAMSEIWGRDERIRQQDVLNVLMELKSSFDTGQRGSEDGIRSVERVLQLLGIEGF